MLGQIRFGPRLELENRTGSALSITSHDEEEAKLSEKWTRKDDEPDYKNFLLPELSNHDWDVISKSMDDVYVGAQKSVRRARGTFSRTSQMSGTFVSDEENLASCTCDDDSRISFGPHDLTGVVYGKQKEKDLMRYMSVDNLDFDLARQHAPTYNEETHVGTFHRGIFRSASTKNSIPLCVERMAPDAKKPMRKDGCIANKDELVQLTKTQLKHVVALRRQLSLSKSDLMCFIMDCYATVRSADQIMRRASEWFCVMLDDLEERILDENVLIRKHREHIDEMLAPILKKLVDLRMLYKAITFLDERLLIYNKTIQCTQQNRESARKILQKLVAYDKEQPEEFAASSTLELTREVSSAFCQLEGTLVNLFPFIINSPLLNTLLETMFGQMRDVLGALSKKTSRRSSQDCIDTSSVHIPSTESVVSDVPNLDGDLNTLFAAPQRRKHCSYLKLDEWPSEETQLNPVAGDTVSSSVILSAKFPTEPLSDFHQSDRSGSSSNSSLFTPGSKNTPEKSKGLISFHSINSMTSCDRPPTFVGSRGPSEISPCSSFEEATLIRKPQVETKWNVSAESSTSTARQQSSSSGCVLNTPDTRRAMKKSKTGRTTKKKPKQSKSLPHRKISKSGRITIPAPGNLQPKSPVEQAPTKTALF